MRKLRFVYSMKLYYSEPVTDEFFSLKCIPHSDIRQKIEELSVNVRPEYCMSQGEDAFGNGYIYGHLNEPHNEFSAMLSGIAVMEDEALGNEMPYVCGYSQDEAELMLYRSSSHYTHPGKYITEYYRRVMCEARMLHLREKSIELAQYYMNSIYHAFQYIKNSTDIYTTAEEAFQLGGGVCQDYAHIMISLCRMSGMPSRYVVGMLSGEGYSHAWVEVFCNGAWYGFDPTNNVLVTNNHIKISAGRDYADCIVNKGIFKGIASQQQNISVMVEEA